MATKEQLEKALHGAHNAGDIPAAKHLARAIKNGEYEQTRLYAANQPVSDTREPAYSPVEGMSGLDKTLTRIGRGFQDTIQGVQQLRAENLNKTTAFEQAHRGGGALGVRSESLTPDADQLDNTQPLVSDEELAELNQRINEELRLFEPLEKDAPVSTFFLRLLGNMASTPVPGAGQGGSLATRLVTNAAINAGVAGTQVVPEGESRAENMMGAAAFTGILESLAPMAKASGRKLINAKQGEFRDKYAQEIIQTGDKHNTPVHLDDVGGNFTKRTSVAAESIPVFGTAPGKIEQAEKGLYAAEKLTKNLAVKSDNDDFFGEITESLGRKLNKLKGQASEKYNRVSELLDDKGGVELPRVDDLIDKLITEEKAFGQQANKNLISILEGYKSGNTPRGNFTHTRELRSRLGSTISDFYRGDNQAIGSQGVEKLQRLKEAVEHDMSDFVFINGPEAQTAWREADAFYSERIAEPFRKTGLKSLVDANEPEKAWRYLTTNGGIESRSRVAYQALDKKGRAAVRYGLVKEALDASIGENRTFSPAKFAKSIEKRMNLVDTFFTGKDKQEIKGFAKLMRHIERAGQVAENPPNGSRLLLPLLGVGAAVADAKTIGAASTAAFTMKKLFQDDRARNLLLAAGKSNAHTKSMEDIADKMATILGRAGSLEQAND